MTIFARILDGSIPCHRIHEDEHCLAFLDINPLSRGHVLLIPRERVAGIHELSDDQAAALGRILPRLCRAVMTATGATAYNVLCNSGAAAGQDVMHVHYHVIPRFRDDDADDAGWGAGLHLAPAWHARPIEDPEPLARAIADAI